MEEDFILKKLGITFVLAVMFMILVSSIASASSGADNGSIRVTKPFINGVPTVDSIPRLDRGVVDLFTTISSVQESL